MAWLTLAESAIGSGFSVELLERLMRDCPKSGEDRTLPFTDIDGVPHIDDRELQAYCRYLREPWPLPPSGTRPHIPTYIRDDVRAESHQGCAICGAMDNGEVAHIEPAAKSSNNSPDNLLLLCPNHHSKYDLGFAPASNVDEKVVRAAKEMKRAARRRMLRYEGNVMTMLRAVLRMIERTEQKAAAAAEPLLQETYKTELQSLVEVVPKLVLQAEAIAAEDRQLTDADRALMEIVPELARQAQLGPMEPTSEAAVRGAGQQLIRVAAPVLALDEVECPRCNGSGQTGLVGDLCAYCGGSCFVTQAEAEAYDPDDIDQVECPRCNGSGQTGLVGDLCGLCKGSCFVSAATAAAYAQGGHD